MPFTTEQLAYAGRAALDFYLKNDPTDNYNVYRPLIELLMSGKKEYGGGLQYVVEQLRYQNDSNFQSYFGDSQVSYNRKRTIQQAKYTWGAFHDGFGLNEDELVANGISVTDDKGATPTEAETVQLTNLLEENLATLKLGFQENFDIMLHRSGSQSATDIPGLDALVSLTPATGIVGGIDPSVNTWWQNYASTGIVSGTAGNVTNAMETAWRACIRVGQEVPDTILAGSAFIDAYRKDSGSQAGYTTRQVFVDANNKKPITLDNGVGTGSKYDTGLYFKGKPIMWDPVFDTMDTLDAPAIAWAKRCYFLNTKRLQLRPIKGHWMIPRRPPRVYDRYVHYWALTAKAALTTGKRNAHAVLAIT
jgi:hypothetical protein